MHVKQTESFKLFKGYQKYNNSANDFTLASKTKVALLQPN